MNPSYDDLEILSLHDKEIIRQIAYDAGKVAMAYFIKTSLQITYKHDNSPLTEADIATNNHIVLNLGKYF